MNGFTLDGYRELLGAFFELGYSTRMFHNADSAAPHLILRHDLDYCLEYAVPIAEAEADLGVCSSFFVLMQSEFYNTSTPNAVRVLHHLRKLGHEIGLHFDASQYAQDTATLDQACADECMRLEQILGQPVTSVSFHRPAKALMGTDASLGGRLHTYQRRFFTDMGYCADSQGRFRFGHPLMHEAVERKTALQLVTHPVWWYAQEAQDPVARIKSFLADRVQVLSHEMAENSIPFQHYLNDHEV